jgi:hypothetical protein
VHGLPFAASRILLIFSATRTAQISLCKFELACGHLVKLAPAVEGPVEVL